MTAYREPGRRPIRCSCCDKVLEPEAIRLAGEGEIVCASCHALGVVARGDARIARWRDSHSPAVYAGAAAVIGVLLGLGFVLRFC
jgi:hypothetical protein